MPDATVDKNVSWLFTDDGKKSQKNTVSPGIKHSIYVSIKKLLLKRFIVIKFDKKLAALYLLGPRRVSWKHSYDAINYCNIMRMRKQGTKLICVWEYRSFDNVNLL